MMYLYLSTVNATTTAGTGDRKPVISNTVKNMVLNKYCRKKFPTHACMQAYQLPPLLNEDIYVWTGELSSGKET